MNLTLYADALGPQYVCLPERACNSAMPEWLQMRVAQCSLTFCGGLNEDVGPNTSLFQQQPSRQMLPDAPAEHTAIVPPQQRSVCSTSDVRWNKIVASVPSVAIEVVTLGPTDAAAVAPCGTTVLTAASSLIVDAADAAQPRFSDEVAQVPVHRCDLDSREPEALSTAAVSPKSSKKRKRERALTLSSSLTSPPKVYKDDQAYQRYLADSKAVSDWVRKTLLER
jgi:hypothetical protein